MKKVPYSIFSSSELYTFATRTADVVAASLSDQPYLTLLVSQVRSGSANLAKALGKALKSEFTSPLEEKDAIRDDCFRGMFHCIKAYVGNRKSIEKAAAANYLMNIIDEIGRSLYNLGYSAETSTINQLFSRFDTAEATRHLETLAVTSWYTDLKEAQTDFETLYQQKVSIESDINLPLAKKSQITIVDNLKSVLDFIERNAQFDSITYTPVCNKIDEIITDVTAIARSRRTKEENAKKEENAATTTK
jgi:hypothetical protein